MKFTKASLNPLYDRLGYYQRYESENGIWTIALLSVQEETRVQAGLTNNFEFPVDLSCGVIQNNILTIYSTVFIWLETFPETVRPIRISHKLPQFDISPVIYDWRWNKFVDDLANKIAARN